MFDLDNVQSLVGYAAVFIAFAGFLLISASPKFSSNRAAKRLKSAKLSRAKLRDETLGVKSTPRGIASHISDRMHKIVKLVQGEASIDNSDLRLKLAQAGKRHRAQLVSYLFFRIALPPVIFIVVLIYDLIVLQGQGAGYVRIVGPAVAAALFGYWLPGILLLNAKKKRQAEILAAYPDMLDLLVICVESGMSIEHALNQVANELAQSSSALVEEVQLTTAELSYLGDRRLAYENFARRTDMQQVQLVVTALIQAERYGTSIGKALRVAAEESRADRQSLLEQKAAALPSKLTVPLVTFFLPAIFVVIIAPAFLK